SGTPNPDPRSDRNPSSSDAESHRIDRADAGSHSYRDLQAADADADAKPGASSEFDHHRKRTAGAAHRGRAICQKQKSHRRGHHQLEFDLVDLHQSERPRAAAATAAGWYL